MTAQRSTLKPGSRTGVEVTDIVPVNEVGSLDELDFLDNAFDDDAEVLYAPELDDLTDTDNLVALQLELRSDLDEEYRACRASASTVSRPPAR